MRQMKDSGVEWIGQIPEGWKIQRLKTVCTVRGEKNKPDAEVLSVYRELGVVKKSERTDNHNITSDDTSNYKYVLPNDLVVNKMKAWQGSMGVSKYEGIVSPAYYVFRITSDKVYPFYLHYLLRDASYLPEYRRLSGGIRPGQWDLSVDSFQNIPILIPKKEEQRRIASYLDHKCSQIDAIIARQQEVIEKLKAYKLSVISEAITKGLDPNAPMKDSGVEWIGKIPEHWEFRKIKKCCDIVDCKNRTPEMIPDGDYVVVRTTCIKDGIFSYDGSYRTDKKNFEEWTVKGQPRYGDIFFTREAPMGEACLVPDDDNLCMGQRVMFFRPIHGEDPRFILYSIYGPLAREYIESKNKGSTVGHLKLGQVASLPLLYCAPEEQKKIANYLDEKCKAINELISCKQEVVGKLQQYKKSLIYEIVTGKKEVYSANGAGKKAESSS